MAGDTQFGREALVNRRPFDATPNAAVFASQDVRVWPVNPLALIIK